MFASHKRIFEFRWHEITAVVVSGMCVLLGAANDTKVHNSLSQNVWPAASQSGATKRALFYSRIRALKLEIRMIHVAGRSRRMLTLF